MNITFEQLSEIIVRINGKRVIAIYEVNKNKCLLINLGGTTVNRPFRMLIVVFNIYLNERRKILWKKKKKIMEQH